MVMSAALNEQVTGKMSKAAISTLSLFIFPKCHQLSALAEPFKVAPGV